MFCKIFYCLVFIVGMLICVVKYVVDFFFSEFENEIFECD